IRAARGYTGRDLILKFDGCYHGHSDAMLVKAGSGLATFGQPSSTGVPAATAGDTVVLPLDDDEALRNFFARSGDKLAAAIIEGVPANNGLLIQRPEYMRLLRSLTEKYGAVLILDEVITGFRLGLGGAAAHYDIEPDLMTYGKIIGGGMPVGAFGGRSDIMHQLSPVGPVYQAGTLSGNPVAMAAGLATLKKLAHGNVYDELESKGSLFADTLASQLRGQGVNLIRLASIFWTVFQDEMPRSASAIDAHGISRYNRMHGQVLDSGIYLPPSGYEVCFLSTAHTDEMVVGAARTLASIINGEMVGDSP
ncbi:MAG: aminotransferase class III-fold pyridoxal phosphate-dependent enzyme, partial [Candidatus Zixiibacteriota bacterium]